MSLDQLKHLNLTSRPEAVAPEDYVPPVDYSEPIQPGTVVIKTVDGKFKDRKNNNTEYAYRLSETKKGYLQAEVALEIADGKVKGKRLFDRWNTTPFENAKDPAMRKQNGFFIALMGFGQEAAYRADEDYVRGLEAIIKSGATAKADVGLEGYCNPNSPDYVGCGLAIKQDSFAKLPNGDYDIRVTCPGTQHEGGQRPTILGKNVISRIRKHNTGSNQ